MSISRQLASRLRQAVQGCTLHLHGPIQAWAAVEKACAEGKADREQVAQHVINSCTNRIDELLADNTQADDARILKEKKTRTFVERLLLGSHIAPSHHTPLLTTPLLTIATIITKQESNREVLLVKHDYVSDGWELPGGLAKTGETVEQTAHRQILQATGLPLTTLRLLGVCSNLVRDDGQHTATLVFSANSHESLLTTKFANSAKFFQIDNLPEMVFDHATLVADFVNRDHAVPAYREADSYNNITSKGF